MGRGIFSRIAANRQARIQRRRARATQCCNHNLCSQAVKVYYCPSQTRVIYQSQPYRAPVPQAQQKIYQTDNNLTRSPEVKPFRNRISPHA